MERTTKNTVRLGDIIVVAFDEAMRMTSDPRRAAMLAAEAVDRMLRGSRLLRGAGQRDLLDVLGTA